MQLHQVDTRDRVRHGLARQEFVLHYQPQFHVPTGRPVAVEALIRWDVDGQGLVLPHRFMSSVADSGMSMELLERTLRLACAQGKNWQDAGFRPIKIAINLSPEQLEHADLCLIIDSVMEEALPDIPWLELELPPGAARDGKGRTQHVLAELKERGFPLALDNYGAQTELDGLAGLPIDKIKIDRSLTRRAGQDPGVAQAVRKVLDVKKSRLNVTLLATGVETENEYGLLAEWGCHLVQGNLLSPALPPDQIARTVFERQTR